MDGLSTVLPFLVTVIIVGALIGANRGSPVLVLKEFRLNESEDEFLTITGRSSGIVSWILSLYGIDPVTSLKCNNDTILFEEAAIRYGKKTLSVPLVAVTGVSSGIHKPFGLLVAGVIFIVGGILMALSLPRYAGGAKVAVFFVGLIVGAIFLVLYSLKKTVMFSIYNGGDRPIATISIKKSIIEGQSINESQFESAANALNKAVLEIHYTLVNGKKQAYGA
jgi:hypothetical protein